MFSKAFHSAFSTRSVKTRSVLVAIKAIVVAIAAATSGTASAYASNSIYGGRSPEISSGRQAEALLSSAARPKGMSADLFIHAALLKAKSSALYSTGGQMAVSESGPVANAKLDRVPVLSASDLQLSFELTRDHRPFTDSDGRLRRATWLYPDDGCFVRAQIASDVIARTTYAKPAKIFAFGNLNVKTANSPSGEVSWWYHVAAIAKVQSPSGDVYYVYDPAMDTKKPIEMNDWLAKMTDPGITVAICHGDTYDPHTDCTNGDAGVLQRAVNESSWYLNYEWARLVELGRDPAAELGDHPPW